MIKYLLLVSILITCTLIVKPNSLTFDVLELIELIKTPNFLNFKLNSTMYGLKMHNLKYNAINKSSIFKPIGDPQFDWSSCIDSKDTDHCIFTTHLKNHGYSDSEVHWMLLRFYLLLMLDEIDLFLSLNLYQVDFNFVIMGDFTKYGDQQNKYKDYDEFVLIISKLGNVYSILGNHDIKLNCFLNSCSCGALEKYHKRLSNYKKSKLDLNIYIPNRRSYVSDKVDPKKVYSGSYSYSVDVNSRSVLFINSYKIGYETTINCRDTIFQIKSCKQFLKSNARKKSLIFIHSSEYIASLTADLPSNLHFVAGHNHEEVYTYHFNNNSLVDLTGTPFGRMKIAFYIISFDGSLLIETFHYSVKCINNAKCNLFRNDQEIYANFSGIKYEHIPITNNFISELILLLKNLGSLFISYPTSSFNMFFNLLK